MLARRWLARGALALLALALPALWLAARTLEDLRPAPRELAPPAADVEWRDWRVLDRRGEPLNATFTTEWNLHDAVPLHEIPEFLRDAFVVAEDKRFFEHGGVDWRARLAAVAQNLRNARGVRGASTITEQVARMLNPRPRGLWAKWLEGFEAAELERRFAKPEILAFYLNQVPYAANRRGVQQAARYYFARDLATLSRKEMLALAVLVRAPSRFDLRRDLPASEQAIERLAEALVAGGKLTPEEARTVVATPLVLETPRLAVAAPHFVQYARADALASGAVPRAGVLVTTLDAGLQAVVQRMLDERIEFLAPRRVANGAVLVLDHVTGEVLAWVVAGGGEENGPRSHIDAVTTPRQPGSALKPFLYALALDRGWSAADVIDDAPLAEATGGGLHAYQNYSRRFYGPVTVRAALGNSLNIPALKTLQHVGAEPYFGTLRALGFEGLTEHPDFYGDGIALGSGAVTLLELVQAYATLANAGRSRVVATRLDDARARPERRVYSAESASLVANILADADARALEFGRESVLTFPVQTAVKTGTSSDFRDAWAVGFDYRHVVGVWMGNLDETPTAGLTGSTGPAMLLRSVFAELVRDAQTAPLYLSPRLERRRVCVPLPPRTTGAECVEREEWFAPDAAQALATNAVARPAVRLSRPTPGLGLAYDPRLPADSQAFAFLLEGVANEDRVVWTIDGRVHSRRGASLAWPVTRGEHRVAAAVWRAGRLVAEVEPVTFSVK